MAFCHKHVYLRILCFSLTELASSCGGICRKIDLSGSALALPELLFSWIDSYRWILVLSMIRP